MRFSFSPRFRENVAHPPSSLCADPSFFNHDYPCDCPTRREIARENAQEEHDRRVNEGLISEPESSDDDDEGGEGRDVFGFERGGGGEAMEVDA